MKSSSRKSVILSSLGIAIATALTSCVVPYDSATVTTYQPGYVTRSLPYGYRTEYIGGVSYYNYNGTYYRPHSRRGEYIVVDAPHRTYYRHDDRIIRTLPPGYRTVRRGDIVYYRHGDTYYQRRGGGYVIVRFP